MTNPKASLSSWLTAPLDGPVRAVVERLRHAPDVQRVALMPDVHLASDVCVGAVVGTRRFIYPQAVGGDIGCGMTTVAFSSGAGLFESAENAAKTIHAFEQALPILKPRQTHPVRLDANKLSNPQLVRFAERDGRYQLGSLGRGNHFVELQKGENDSLWVCVHSGSRSIGRQIMSSHLRGHRQKLVALDSKEQAGLDYLNDQDWALDYARRNRRILLDNACRVLHDLFDMEPVAESIIECHHNHVRLEDFAEGSLWVHRKGAMPAGIGEIGIIPGSMGSHTHHVEGRGCEESMRSSSHGAGRTCSRTEIRKQISTRDLLQQMKGVWFDTRKANALRDEAPAAYRDISKVMRAQKELTRIIRTLSPILSYKG